MNEHQSAPPSSSAIPSVLPQWLLSPAHLLILLHLAVTVLLAYGLSLGLDETFTLNTTGGSLRYAINQAIHFELQAPLYFALLSVLRVVSKSLFWGRLLSVVSIAATIKIAEMLGRRLYPRIRSEWIVLILAFHPYLIWAATEMRVYAFAIFLSSLLLLVFHDAYLAEEPSRKMQLAYAAVALVGLYTHYYLGFILVANGIALLVVRRGRWVGTYLLSMAGVGLCFAPLLLLVPGQVSEHTRTVSDLVGLTRAAEIVSWSVKGFLIPAEATPFEIVRRWLIRACYLAVMFILIKKRRELTNPSVIFVFCVFAAVAVTYVPVIHITGAAMGQTRHFFALFLPAMFLLLSLLTLFGKRPRVAAVALAVIVVFCLASLFFTYRSLAKYGHWKEVTAYVMKHEVPGQPIVVFHAGNAMTFGYYYRGPNTLIPLPRDNRFDTFDLHDYVLRDEGEIREVLVRKGGDPDALWLVTDGVCGFMDLDYHCEILNEFVMKNFVVESTTIFDTTTVRFLRRKK